MQTFESITARSPSSRYNTHRPLHVSTASAIAHAPEPLLLYSPLLLSSNPRLHCSDVFFPSFLPWPSVCVIRRTPYAKIQARLQFPEGYPTTPLIVELTNASLPHPFLRKLTQKAEEMARGCGPAEANAVSTGELENASGSATCAEGRGTGRAVAALGVVLDAVNKNKFLPCWKELRQTAALVTTR